MQFLGGGVGKDVELLLGSERGKGDGRVIAGTVVVIGDLDAFGNQALRVCLLSAVHDGLLEVIDGGGKRVNGFLVSIVTHGTAHEPEGAVPGVTLTFLGIDQQMRNGQEHGDGGRVVVSARDVGRETTRHDASGCHEHVGARDERYDPQDRIDDLGPGKRQQPDEEDGDKANHAVEDDLVQQRSMRDDLGRRLGLGTHGVDMRGDDYLLAATRIVGDARGNVLGHDVLRDTTRTHLRQDGIVVVLGEIHEEATDDENQADDEHAERNARHEDADAGNDRT